MEVAVLFGTFAVLLLIGTPVAFCLGVASFATVIYLGLPPVVVFQRLNAGISVFALMAIPFFIYAGELMVRGDIARRLVALAGAAVGHLRGGLGQVNITASVLFGGISGSAAADASAIGGLMIPQMEKRGYDRDYAVNITVVSSIIALMLPPSHNLIIYSIAGGGRISIADLFTAGIIPGLILALSLMVAAWIVARRRGYDTEPFPGGRAILGLLLSATPGLILIGIIFGGVRSGVFTASESSCIAVVYALAITVFVYRTMSWRDFVAATLGAVRTTSMVLLVIGSAAAFGWLLAYLRVPAALVELMQGVSNNPIVILLQRAAALSRHVHGHEPAHRHHHADLPAGGDGLWRRSRALRHHPGAEPRHRPLHAARRRGALRRLRRGPAAGLGRGQDDLAFLPRRGLHAAPRHLHPGPVALAAGAVPVAA